MIDYIKNHQINSEQEQKIISYIESNVKINPTGVIDWHKMRDVSCMEKVSENDFLRRMQEMLQNFRASFQNTYFILQVNDFHPPLKSNLKDYFVYITEILQCDTIFLCEDRSHILHYDFYGDLWGKNLPSN